MDSPNTQLLVSDILQSLDLSQGNESQRAAITNVISGYKKTCMKVYVLSYKENADDAWVIFGVYSTRELARDNASLLWSDWTIENFEVE